MLEGPADSKGTYPCTWQHPARAPAGLAPPVFPLARLAGMIAGIPDQSGTRPGRAKGQNQQGATQNSRGHGARMERVDRRLNRGAMVAAALSGLMLVGCNAENNPFTRNNNSAEGSEASPSETSVRLVDRDVEAPQVFQVADQALWDGRPSLGGVWVASPDATDPERVILRNPANGKFVIGALFRRERVNPGPPLQISSDAAAALGILAGQPAQINVTALRREEVPVETPDATRPILDAAETVETASLDAPAAAAAALDRVDTQRPATPPAATAAPATPARPAAAAPAASGRNLVQIGIFSVEANAKRAADSVTKAGIAANILRESSQGKTFWRVTAGPAPAGGRDAMLAKVKGLGFTDAYFVSR